MIYELKKLWNDQSHSSFQSLHRFANFANFRECAKNGLNPKSDVTTWFMKEKYGEMICHTGTFQLVLMFAIIRETANRKKINEYSIVHEILRRIIICNKNWGSHSHLKSQSWCLVREFQYCQKFFAKIKEIRVFSYFSKTPTDSEQFEWVIHWWTPCIKTFFFF
jgi:hypothetical protein